MGSKLGSVLHRNYERTKRNIRAFKGWCESQFWGIPKAKKLFPCWFLVVAASMSTLVVREVQTELARRKSSLHSEGAQMPRSCWREACRINQAHLSPLRHLNQRWIECNKIYSLSPVPLLAPSCWSAFYLTLAAWHRKGHILSGVKEHLLQSLYNFYTHSFWQVKKKKLQYLREKKVTIKRKKKPNKQMTQILYLTDKVLWLL